MVSVPEHSLRAKWYKCEIGQGTVFMTRSGKRRDLCSNQLLRGLYKQQGLSIQSKVAHYQGYLILAYDCLHGNDLSSVLCSQLSSKPWHSK